MGILWCIISNRCLYKQFIGRQITELRKIQSVDAGILILVTINLYTINSNITQS